MSESSDDWLEGVELGRMPGLCDVGSDTDSGKGDDYIDSDNESDDWLEGVAFQADKGFNYFYNVLGSIPPINSSLF